MESKERDDEIHEHTSAVAGGARSQRAGLVIAGGAAAIAIGWVWSSYLQHAPRQQEATNEEFRKGAYQAPDLSAPPAPKGDSVVVMQPAPPPPAAPPPPQVAPLPANTVPPIDTEADRMREDRLRSPAIVMDSSQSKGGSTSLDTTSAGTGGPGGDSNRAFLAQVSGETVATSVAQRLKRIDALIAQGTFIRATLETAINSDLAGDVRAVTLEDVWSFDGRRVLIPAGSRLVGQYRSGISRGQTRVFVAWTRLLRPDGVSVMLGSIGTDALGRTGMPGDVDQHWFERFGSAVLLSVVGGVSTYVAGQGQNQNQNFYGNSNSVDNTQSAQTIAQQTIATTFAQLANTALQDSINIPPTINIDQGTPVIVFVRKDLDFSALYPDPVQEQLRELRSR